MIYEITIFTAKEYFARLTNNCDGNKIIEIADYLNAESVSITRHPLDIKLEHDIVGDYNIKQFWKDHYQEYENQQL